MQSMPDFAGADPAAAPQGNPTDGGDPSQDPTQMGGDPSQGGGDPTQPADPTQGGAASPFMSPDDGNDPTAGADQNLAGVQHGSFMGGADSQYAGSDTMLNQDDTQVSPEEQKAYEDFVTRALLFINDTRKPLGTNKKPNQSAQSPADTIIAHLNIKGMPTDQAVGRTTAQVCWLIFSNAKHQGVDYPPDVLYHGADEVMSHVYEIGVRSGAIKNAPPPNSPQEQKLLGMAKMYACQYFGNNVIDSGLNDQKGNQQFYLQQMQREHDTGALDQWNPGDNMNPSQLSDFLHRASSGQGALASNRPQPPTSIADFKARGHPSLVPAGGPPQPPAQAAAPPDDGSGGGAADQGAPQQ